MTQVAYRAPEVLARQRFPSTRTARQSSIDMWGAGVICSALHVACHLFYKLLEDTPPLQILQAMINLLGPPEDQGEGNVILLFVI